MPAAHCVAALDATVTRSSDHSAAVTVIITITITITLVVTTIMYSVTVTRDFVAQHFLTVPDPGPEGELHSHRFGAEVTLEGPKLNEYGYLLDIDAVKAALDELEDRYRDATLNDLPEFEGRNPSVEHFAREFCEGFLDRVEAPQAERIAVTMYEDEEAWATYERSL